MFDWKSDLATSSLPFYVSLADCIAKDITAGRLAPGDRLPPQRQLAKQLGVDFTTVARGYAEAQRRGLLESRGSQGTYVLRAPQALPASSLPPRQWPSTTNLLMNLPPEPDDPDLIARMTEGWEAIGRDMIPLLRYQVFGGAAADKEAGIRWLGQRMLAPKHEQLFITPGAQPALFGVLSLVAKAGQTVLCERLTYPGLRSIAAQIGITLVGIPFDEHGIDPEAFAAACSAHNPRALYLNPTLHNPTTATIPRHRRDEIVSVARRFKLPIIEDDAYGVLPLDTPAPFAVLAPELTWYVASLAKSIGAGLRIAYVVAPDMQSGWAFAATVRGVTIMATPITTALTTRWIQDGTADRLLQFIRTEAVARQTIAQRILPPGSFKADPNGFHVWLNLGDGWTRSAFASHLRATGISVVPSDPFATDGAPPEAIRLGLGGPISRGELQSALEFAAPALKEKPAIAASSF